VKNTDSDNSPILQVKDVSLRFGGVHALTDVSFDVYKNQIYSIIGPNGAGKTSMLNCISGRYKPQEGSVTFKGKPILQESINDRAKLGIGRTFQNLALFGHMSVIDNIMVGRHHLLKNNFLTGAAYWFGGAQKEELEARERVEEVIDLMEIQNVRNEPAGTLSYGLRKRVELARAIAIEPELILLDEPMAGMNLEEKEDMARYIIELNQRLGITIVMIEHDMGIVVDISSYITVLDFGKNIADGLPDEVMAHPQVRSAYLGEDVDLAAEAAQ